MFQHISATLYSLFIRIISEGRANKERTKSEQTQDKVARIVLETGSHKMILLLNSAQTIEAAMATFSDSDRLPESG